MPIPLDAPEVLNREFLPIRAKILEIGAALDRLDRAAGDPGDDARLAQIRRGLEVLLSADGNRAEQIQMVFSLPFDENWQANFARDGWREGRLPARSK